MFKRATTLGDAFITATVKHIKRGEKVDHRAGTGHWVARRVMANALEKPNFGIVIEQDHYPRKGN